MNTRTQPVREFFLALAGPVVWAAHFFVVYGLEAAVCTRAASPVLTMRWVIAAATAAALATLAAFLIPRLRRRSESEDREFLRRIAVGLTFVSIGAILAVAASALSLPACVPPAG